MSKFLFEQSTCCIILTCMGDLRPNFNFQIELSCAEFLNLENVRVSRHGQI